MFQTASIADSVIISLVGMGVVFIGLVILYYSMIFLEKLLNPKPTAENTESEARAAALRSGDDRRNGAERRSDDPARTDGTAGESGPEDPSVQAEKAAAVIALSLYLYNKKYDEAKQFMLTGKKRDIPHKPWTLAGRLREVSRDSARFNK